MPKLLRGAPPPGQYRRDLRSQGLGTQLKNLEDFPALLGLGFQHPGRSFAQYSARNHELTQGLAEHATAVR